MAILRERYLGRCNEHLSLVYAPHADHPQAEAGHATPRKDYNLSAMNVKRREMEIQVCYVPSAGMESMVGYCGTRTNIGSARGWVLYTEESSLTENNEAIHIGAKRTGCCPNVCLAVCLDNDIRAVPSGSDSCP
jgi:hypothetical protein